MILYGSVSPTAAQTLTPTSDLRSPTHAGVALVDIQNFKGCVELKNETTRVVLGHHRGGRVLIYETNGTNVLYLDESESNQDLSNPKTKKRVSAGRFDVGPEYLSPRSATTWSGEWTVEVTGDRSARMTSQVDSKTSIQVTRDFKLNPKSSQLSITQTVENLSAQPVRHNYWSRTFARHGGIAIVPCNSKTSLLPNLYYMSQTRYLINYKPEDAAVRRVNDYLLVEGPTKFPKLGFDSVRGWVAYQSPTDQLFVKIFPTHADKDYGDPGDINLSIWYPQKEQVNACEIEPIGPLVNLQPGEKSSFSVRWFLLDSKFPADGEQISPQSVAKLVGDWCIKPNSRR